MVRAISGINELARPVVDKSPLTVKKAGGLVLTVNTFKNKNTTKIKAKRDEGLFVTQVRKD